MSIKVLKKERALDLKPPIDNFTVRLSVVSCVKWFSFPFVLYLFLQDFLICWNWNISFLWCHLFSWSLILLSFFFSLSLTHSYWFHLSPFETIFTNFSFFFFFISHIVLFSFIYWSLLTLFLYFFVSISLKLCCPHVRLIVILKQCFFIYFYGLWFNKKVTKSPLNNPW